MSSTRFSIRSDLAGIRRAIDRNLPLATVMLTQQVLKDANNYIPADTWALRNSSLTASNFEEGKVVWNTPYARKVFYGVNMNFSADKNVNAQAHWFTKAKSVHSKEWLKVVKAAMREL